MAPLYAPQSLNAPLFNTFSIFQISYAKPNRVISFLVVLVVEENPNCGTANRNATNDKFGLLGFTNLHPSYSSHDLLFLCIRHSQIQ